MSCTLIHLAIADKIYGKLGGEVIRNASLFFGGNIAPDAVHVKPDYQRAHKKHSHLCDGISLYGYGYPEMEKLFLYRVNEFYENYYLKADKDNDLYLGYIVHLLVDKLDMFSACERLKAHLKKRGRDTTDPDFCRSLADEINGGNYKTFFKEDAVTYDILAQAYKFGQKVTDVLDAERDYEVKDYIDAKEINLNKLWVINNVVKCKLAQENPMIDKTNKAVMFIDFAAEQIVITFRQCRELPFYPESRL